MPTVGSEKKGAAGGVNAEGGADAALYLETKLSDAVRNSIEAVLHNRPREPIRALAQSLRAHHDTSSASTVDLEQAPRAVKAVVDAFYSVIGQRTATAPTPPLSLRLHDDKPHRVRPLAADFDRRYARQGGNYPLSPPPPSFPSLLYREAASVFEVGSCLRRLRQLSPQAPLLLFIESPPPNLPVFFYEGIPYGCSAEDPESCAAVTTMDVTEQVRAALSSCGGRVQSFEEALRSAAAEVASAVGVELLPSVQTNCLAAFDQVTSALEEAVAESEERARAADERAGTRAGEPVPPLLLPYVLLVSYRAETARLTHARLLAAYGPYYEAAQRRALWALRHGQLERKQQFTFAFAVEYWAQVQRRRETCSSGAAFTKAASQSSVGAGAAVAADAVEKERLSADAVTTTAAEVKARAMVKRAAARSAKRSLPSYDADHQAEDDVFLVVIRRLEHAAATLIQSVYRGHRARVRCQQTRRVLSSQTERTCAYGPPMVQDAVVFGVDTTPPLLRASLIRLCEEGKRFQDVWANFPTSSPPDSRRCWIYRPVQHTVKATLPTNDAAGSVHPKDTGKSEVTRTREDWVQEELLIPPLRATQPRVRINLAQRLVDYLAVAQCTLLRDTVQLFADSPGMSVLQRRAYDSIKSICLTLFFVAYSELRQRERKAVPPTFSKYMREMHEAVLTWFQFPHESSLLLRAVRECGGVEGNTPERAAAAYVHMRLVAREMFLVACPQAKTSASADVQTGGEGLMRLSTHLFLSPQPFLPHAQWTKELGALAHTLVGLSPAAGSASTDNPTATVNWWSIAPVPSCSVEGTPVAAIGRWDTQMLDGAPAYDCFVPRVRTVAADSVTERAAAAAPSYSARVGPADVVVAAATAAAIDDASATEAVGEWLRGDLADAADGALAQHTRSMVSRDGYLECYQDSTKQKASASSSTGASFTSFIAVPHDAVLTKYLAVRPAHATVLHVQAYTEDSSSFRADERVSTAVGSPTTRRRSIERRGGWGRVMEAVANELAASQQNSPLRSSIMNSPRAGMSGFGRSRQVTPQLSPSAAGSTSTADSQEVSNTMDNKAATLKLEESEVQPTPVTTATNVATADIPHGPQNTTWAVRTVTEVANAVAASSPVVTMRHTRRALRFLPGLEGAKQLDTFVDAVATAMMMNNSASNVTCLVLGLDVASQAFFALAAMLVDHRLHNNRKALPMSTSSDRGVKPNSVQNAECDVNADSDAHLCFLSGYHEVLYSTLVDTSASNTPARRPEGEQNASVELAVAHVSGLLNAATGSALPLNLLARLKDALQHAEAAQTRSTADVQLHTTAAVQLAEQYAWLVLLEWYLWSRYFPFACPSGFTPVRRRPSAQPGKQSGFAEVMRTAPAVMQWIEQMDPWATTPERCPDHLHRRYSNGLRRWDDKHYVCFGAS